MKQDNEKFCHECGAIINIKAEICPECGGRQPYTYFDSEEQQQSEKEWITTLLLCLFLGGLGIHRFYTRYTVIGIIQLLTLGGCGVWSLVDLIMIIIGNYKDADGKPIKNR